MRISRCQYTNEFKRKAVELLASSGRPLSQIAQELGIAPSRLRAWRNRISGSQAGLLRRPKTLAAIPPGGLDLAAGNARLRRENERMRMEREILKNAAHLSGATGMKFRFIENRRETFPVRVLCDDMGVSAAGYYAWRGRYGAPSIHATLRSLGHTASRGRVERLMCHHGIKAIMPRRFRACTTESHHDWPIAPNRLGQKFIAKRPNQV